MNNRIEEAAETFEGFQPFQSNFTYASNQFVDVCQRYYSKGCAQVVGYLIRRQFGFPDDQKNPESILLEASWADFLNKKHGAGISRGALRKALDEAIAANFIEEVRKAQPARQGSSSITALFTLKWDESRLPYHTNPEQFEGFFLGDRCRTHYPDEFQTFKFLHR